MVTLIVKYLRMLCRKKRKGQGTEESADKKQKPENPEEMALKVILK